MRLSKNETKKQKLLTKDQMIEKMRKINTKHNDNMESRKNALKTLMSGIPVGNKVFVLVPVEDLHIDESYQRPVQSHVRTIAEEWDDMKCDPLKINFREDGNLYVWDGMMFETMNRSTHGRMSEYMETATLVDRISLHPSKYW